jgi:hypothetical protein
LVLFHEPTLKSFNALRCRPWQIGPVLTSSYFVTIFFLVGVRLSAPSPQLGSYQVDFHVIWCLRIFRKSIKKKLKYH